MPRKGEYRKKLDYYRKYARDYYHRHKEKISQKTGEYVKRRYRENKEYRELVKRHAYDYVKKMRKIWNEGVIYDNLNSWRCQITKQAEKIASEIILPYEGFTNIIPTSGNIVKTQNFPFFDTLAEKDGQKCGISVTCAVFFPIRRREALSTLLKFFNMRYFVCLIKPNLKQYVLLEYDKAPSKIRLTKSMLTLLKNIPHQKVILNASGEKQAKLTDYREEIN